MSHPYIKYGMALVMLENSLHDEREIRIEHIVDEIEKGLHTFRLKPHNDYIGKDSVAFDYTDEDGKAENFLFLSPHVVTIDKQAGKVRDAAKGYIKEAMSPKDKFLQKVDKLGLSEVPIVGEFTSFSKTIGRGAAKSTKLEQGLGLVTTLTRYKPSITRYKPSISNSCLIPDLDINDMMDFISIFKRLLVVSTNSLLIGKVKVEENKGIKKYSPQRPKIYNGNFPNAPRTSILGSIALLGAIGELGKEEEYSEMVKRVLDNLREKPIYIIRFGDAESFTFNNFVIELAKNAELASVVDAIYFSRLYNQEKRNLGNPEYEKFDLFTSRFLQLFNRPSFNEFLSFRAEYPNKVESLFTTYFNKMEKIDRTIIDSAKNLGHWLNYVAYKSACEDKAIHLTLQQKKAKVLVELESSIFAAKTSDALIAQTITRAGRLSGNDAPSESERFIMAVLSGDIDLSVAKNLLIAFSRIKTFKESDSEGPALEEPDSDYEAESNDSQIDYSQI